MNKSAGGWCDADIDIEQSDDLGRPAGDQCDAGDTHADMPQSDGQKKPARGQSDMNKPAEGRYAAHVDEERSDKSKTSAGSWYDADADGGQSKVNKPDDGRCGAQVGEGQSDDLGNPAACRCDTCYAHADGGAE